MTQTLIATINQCCKEFADRPAFTCLGHSLSFSQIDADADAFARFLQHRLGLVKGDRIAIQLPNLLQYPVAVIGALRAGLVVVNTNPLYTVREMLHQFTDAGVRAVLVLADFQGKVSAVQHRTAVEFVIVSNVADLHPVPKRWLINGLVKWRNRKTRGSRPTDAVSFRAALERGRQSPPLTLATLETEDLAFLQYTGGTTGVAKGAMLSQGNMAANLEQVMTALKEIWQPGRELLVAPLPLYHIFACLACMLLGIRGGAEVLLIPNPRDIPAFVKTLSGRQFSLFMGLNTLFNALCRNPDFARLDFSSLKLTVSGGTALTTDTAQKWLEVTGNQIVEGYGLTETSPVVALNPVTAPRVGSIGRALVDTEVRLVSQGQPVSPGEPGELQVRGPQVMLGYWQRPDATAEMIDADGWLSTGDIAIQEPDGYLRIVDRIKDMIIVSGFNVYPNEIEDEISKHPDIVECAAVGVADSDSGEAVKLFVVSSNPNLTVEDVRTYARQNLTGYKVPKFVEFADELPKSNVGKVLRRELRDR